jgi:hypothetical protein
MIWSHICADYIIFNLSFFELQPSYECLQKNGNYVACEASDFCGREVQHRINWNDEKSLKNWVEQLDIECNLS